MSAVRRIFGPALGWQSRAVLARHLRVHLRKLAHGPRAAARRATRDAADVRRRPSAPRLEISRGVGRRRTTCRISRPGILAYTVFMTAFFPVDLLRLHADAFPKILGRGSSRRRCGWSMSCGPRCCGPRRSRLSMPWSCASCSRDSASRARWALHWTWLPLALPAAVPRRGGVCLGGACSSPRSLPSIDHMGLPFFPRHPADRFHE